MTPHPQQEYIVDILKVDTKLEKYVEDFVTFSKREKTETVEEIHDIIVSCSYKAPTPAAPSPICQVCIIDQEPFCIGCERLQPHDATIRTQALDELIDELPNVERSFGGEQIDTYIETHELKELIESLRTPSTKEQKQK